MGNDKQQQLSEGISMKNAVTSKIMTEIETNALKLERSTRALRLYLGQTTKVIVSHQF
jgi:hypothetical protein